MKLYRLHYRDSRGDTHVRRILTIDTIGTSQMYDKFAASFGNLDPAGDYVIFSSWKDLTDYDDKGEPVTGELTVVLDGRFIVIRLNEIEDIELEPISHPFKVVDRTNIQGGVKKVDPSQNS